MTSVDANWLLSTTAQSAAALVAIVGGFLVSRVVGLQSVREGLLHRREEVETQRHLTELDFQRVWTERHAYSARKFRKHHLSEVIRLRGEIDVDELLDDFQPIGSEDEEMREVAEELAATVKRAFFAMKEAMGPNQISAPSLADLRKQGVQIAEDDEEVFSSVASAITVEGRRPFGDSLGTHTFYNAISLPESDVVFQRQERRIELESDLRGRLSLMEADLAIIEQELRKIASPRGVGRGIGVLSYLAVVSVIVPLVLMSLRPVPASALARAIVVLLFVSGLGALIWYLVWSLKTLSSETDNRGS